MKCIIKCIKIFQMFNIYIPYIITRMFVLFEAKN